MRRDIANLKLAHDRARGHAQWNGEINQRELSKLLDEMEITNEVRFKLTAGVYKRGSHRWRKFYHYVTMSKYLTVLQARKTICHELTHAVQLESFFKSGCTQKDWDEAYGFYQRKVGYKNNPYELEARAAYRCFDHYMVIDQDPYLHGWNPSELGSGDTLANFRLLRDLTDE